VDTPAAVISHATTSRQRVCTGTLADIAGKVQAMQLSSPAMIVVGDVVNLRPQLRFFENQPLFGKSYLLPKIGREPSRLAAMLREQGTSVTERTVGQIVGIPAVYTAKELAQVDLLLFTSANGVQYFLRNLFASGLDVRALAHAKLVAIGAKTAEKLQDYGLRADLIPEQYNSDTLAQEVRQFIDKHCQKSPFERAVTWYPAAKNADDHLVDALLSVCDCGRLNVYENLAVDADRSDDLSAYDGILFTCASSAERLLAPCDEETRTTLGTRTAIYSIGPKCSAALRALGVSPVVEASVSTYEGLFHTVMQR
jgi:uroporphyrinogen III methyltransferase/synthase